MNTMKPLQEQAYDHLLKMIEAGELEFGTMYSETKMCSLIGISRTPFRSALVRLNQNKIIDIFPSKGFQVHELTKEDMLNIYQMRVAIESYAAIYMASHLEDSYVQKCISGMKEDLSHMFAMADDPGDMKQFFQYDYDFHESMLKATHNVEFLEMYTMYQYRISSSAKKILSLKGRPLLACQEHERLLSGIETGATPNELYEYTDAHQRPMRLRADEALHHH